MQDMTEEEWQTAEDPDALHQILLEVSSRRKAELYEVACCRRILYLVAAPASLNAFRQLERHADDPLLPSDVAVLLDAAKAAANSLYDTGYETAPKAARWMAADAIAAAWEGYQTHDFAAMPILADVLQNVGCNDEQLLGHCRAFGSHVRGCWVVDLVLGKG